MLVWILLGTVLWGLYVILGDSREVRWRTPPGWVPEEPLLSAFVHERSAFRTQSVWQNGGIVVGSEEEEVELGRSGVDLEDRIRESLEQWNHSFVVPERSEGASINGPELRLSLRDRVLQVVNQYHGRVHPSLSRTNWSKDSGALWRRMKDEVAIVVKTGKEVAPTRMKKLSQWLHVSDVPNLMFISDHGDENLGLVDLREVTREIFRDLSSSKYRLDSDGVPHDVLLGGWRGDKDKNLPGFLALYYRFPSAKFYIMVDDDTYVFLENLAHILSRRWRYAFSKPEWGGNAYRIACLPWSRKGTTSGVANPIFAHGGSGIVLNHRAMQSLSPLVPSCLQKYVICWAGDMMLSACLLENGLPFSLRIPEMVGDPPSRQLFSSKYHTLWTSELKIATLHKLSEQELEWVSQYDQLRGPGHIDFASLRKHLLQSGLQKSEPERKFNMEGDILKR
uniref:N-acetylgalactosaminide beta-1,3-galactosyltransferase n=1 Tax=Compsopogon caeruleus TaxID=31354 RepID=A0A7S1T5I8_9RHOD